MGLLGHLIRRFSFHQKDAPEKVQDPVEDLCLQADVGAPQNGVSRNREVWASLFRLLPPPPSSANAVEDADGWIKINDIPTISMKSTKACTLTQVLKKWNSFVKDGSCRQRNMQGKLFLHQRAFQSTFTQKSWFNLLLVMLKRFLYTSNWVTRICKNRKWLHIMFVTQHLQSLSPVLISSQSCLSLTTFHRNTEPFRRIFIS